MKLILKQILILFSNRIELSIEQGLYQKFTDDFEKYLTSLMKIGFEIYENLNTLVDHYIFYKNLNFNDFEIIFICFFGFNTLILVAFLAHHFINYLIKIRNEF